MNGYKKAADVASRKIAPNHEEWVPHRYQRRAVDHLLDRGVAALFLDPGLGKTSIVLDAFRRLKEGGVSRKMLVVAPLRVCQLVWRQEGARWTQFRDLTFSLVHGSPKLRQEALDADADIYLINPEGIAWLAKQFPGGRGWPFDVVTVDELTKFKNSRAARHKALLPLIMKTSRRWGLTGTPTPNGLMDLFGQMLLLDGGVALGKWITHYRDRYFVQSFNGFDWALRRGADEKIADKISRYVLRMSAEDYLDLPQCIDDIREIRLDAKARKKYDTMKQEMIVEFGDEKIIAANAAAVYSKLKQMANGAVYVEATPDRPRHHVHVHDLKLDALEELIDELQGEPLLVGYEFQHDLERIKERLGQDTPHLGRGVSTKRAEEIERDWNAGKIPVLLAHPASAGHGLNFQRGGASHLCWFSVSIDYELYDQFLKRILRQGNTASHVINHALIVVDTYDAISLDVVGGKAVSQARFLQSLSAELEGSSIDQGEMTMGIRKLKRKAEVEETAEEAPRKRRRVRKTDEVEEDEEDVEDEAPRGRGFSRKVRDRMADDDGDGDEADEEEEADEEDDEPKQRRRTRRKLTQEDEEDDTSEESDEEPEEKPKPKRTRRTRKKDASDSDGGTDEGDAGENTESSSDMAPSAIALTPEERRRSDRNSALYHAIQAADRLSLKTPADITKAADIFYKYIAGE